VRSYLQVAYRPIAPPVSIHLVASTTNVNDAPTAVEVVPIFTSADATQPSFAMNGSIGMGPIGGPEKARSATAKMMAVTGFVRMTLPDGSLPTSWRLEVTGCGPIGDKQVVISVRVGSAAPVEVGSCSDGSMLSTQTSLPLPPDGTKVTLLSSGGTTRSQLRVSEFQWRGDRD
jgi:hypothetical protein